MYGIKCRISPYVRIVQYGTGAATWGYMLNQVLKWKEVHWLVSRPVETDHQFTPTQPSFAKGEKCAMLEK